MKNFEERSLQVHEEHKGKIALQVKTKLKTRDDLSTLYTPGVAAVSSAIAKDKELMWKYTARGNFVAIVTDGSRVLGLGNIGPEAAMPVMEGKAILFKEFGNVDAFPICLATQDTEEIIKTVKYLAPNFAGINLEDIESPKCFEIEKRLKAELNIPVFHDDQHGTAIVALAGLLNALKITGRTIESARIVVNGVGAAGSAIVKLLHKAGAKQIIPLDSKGIISSHRTDLTPDKKELLAFSQSQNQSGSLADALQGADAFIGVSKPGVLNAQLIKKMNKKPIVFALANPTPEIMPEEAKKAGVAIMATGRSDYPNQVNNVLAFPGIFRGAFDAHAKQITEEMKLAAAYALANYLPKPTPSRILPSALDKKVAAVIALAVKQAWQK